MQEVKIRITDDAYVTAQERARLDCRARRWPLAAMSFLCAKAARGRFAQQKLMEAISHADGAQSPRSGRSEAEQSRSDLTARRRRGPRRWG